MPDAVWNAANYQDQFGYVWQFGESLISQLAPQPGERILDLGCGTGQLTNAIADHGAVALGIDSDPAMISQAKANYPTLSFRTDSADSFQLLTPVDAIFSNAVLHWVPRAKAAASCMANALKPGGRLVVELGSQGNMQTILTALEAISGKHNLNPWYFPKLGEYVAILEAAGLSVTYAHSFDRPTPLGASGLTGWLDMFAQRFFQHLSTEAWSDLVHQVEAAVPQLYQDGIWIADYRRLRVIALKI
ncbi:Methyltransferase domain family [Synechococcus sp. PCC 7335]|uniref:class I SAM-dependent methyltransferase n=1 Tax=Synechococcus sp. (strain ATCC 29403 / PCC 7335) TaxID=91464 RepID=UPI00017EE087|nr:class I SAM-dependent methyltransferase [Synechococcus sp. PCC 7335]EDX85195.1 Methyltransferase domain family [Synechococcus sp. PCC 7335]